MREELLLQETKAKGVGESHFAKDQGLIPGGESPPLCSLPDKFFFLPLPNTYSNPYQILGFHAIQFEPPNLKYFHFYLNYQQ